MITWKREQNCDNFSDVETLMLVTQSGNSVKELLDEFHCSHIPHL